MKHSQPYGQGQPHEVALHSGNSNGHVAPAPVQINTAPQDDSVSLFEYWDIIRRRKKSILLTCVACGLLGWLVTLPMTPIYQARASLEIVRQDDAVMAMTGQTRTYSSQRQETAYIRNQVEFLKSEPLIERVVEKLQLHKAPEKKEGPGLVARVMGWFKPATPAADQPTPLQRAVKRASANLTITVPPESDIIELYFDSANRETAAKFANTLAEEYIEQSLAVRWEVSQRTTEWLTKQLENMKQKLADSERALQAYADTHQLIFTRDTDSVSEEELRRIQDELSRAMAARIERQSRFEMASDSPVESLPEVINDSTLRQYQIDLTNLKRQEADLLVSLTPEHHRVKHVQAQIAELESTLERERTRIMGLMENEYEAANRREKLLVDRFKQQLNTVSSESAKSIQYNLMKREVDTNRELYQSLMHRVKEAGVTSAIRANASRVVDPAQVPMAPYKPNALLNAGIGLFLGLFLGVAVAFGRERTDRTVKVPGELHFHLRVPELGVIPRFRAIANGASKRSYLPSGKVSLGVNGKSAENGKNGHTSDLVTWQREPSVDAESFRAALTSILFCRNGNPPAVIAFTSPQSSEGKTTVVSNLAVALAEINRRVLIIDGDLRRPRLDRVLGEPNGWGLSDLLREGESLEDRPLDYLVQKTKIPNVHAVFSGRRTANASNLLHSPRLPELIKRFRQEFDAVLIDAPPVLGLPDARVLGHLADGVILVLRAGQTTLETARAARQRLADDGTPVLGTILNGWDPKEAKYGDYSYSGYAYEPDAVTARVST